MIPDELGQKLHDRSTRGEALSTEEQERLLRWYAHHDQEEMAQLNAAPVPSRLAELQSQVQQVTAQVVVQAQHIESLTIENAQLRQEIASLQRLLSTKLARPTGSGEVAESLRRFLEAGEEPRRELPKSDGGLAATASPTAPLPVPVDSER